MPFQPELTYNPTDKDQFFVKLGFAAGNGLNEDSPFCLRALGGGHGRRLEEHQRARPELSTGGLVRTHLQARRRPQCPDHRAASSIPTIYVDENAYANDEFTQFMNEAFVNSRNAFLPSYDMGGASGLEDQGLDLQRGRHEHRRERRREQLQLLRRRGRLSPQDPLGRGQLPGYVLRHIPRVPGSRRGEPGRKGGLDSVLRPGAGQRRRRLPAIRMAER